MPDSATSYTAAPLMRDGALADVRVDFGGKTAHMWGRDGRARELELADRADAGSVPVLLGAGLGIAVRGLLDRGFDTVAVVDRETAIQELTKTREEFRDDSRVVWIDAQSAAEAAALLKGLDTKGRPFTPLTIPLYLRLDREFYKAVSLALASPRHSENEARARFRSTEPRILLLTSQYFLLGEIVAACERMGVPHLLINLGRNTLTAESFVQTVTEAVATFRPDFVFTVNHLGVDREGVLLELLEKLDLPLASWFVDNPHLILYLYPQAHSARTAIFTWDRDNIPTLQGKGFTNLFHLPLAADTTRFRPMRDPNPNPDWKADISFVGNSMTAKIGHRLAAARPPKPLLKAYKSIAADFGEQPEPSVAEYLRQSRPDMLPFFEALPSVDRKLAFETLVTWEATRQYRTSRLERILPFHPLIVGDKGWKKEFRNSDAWRYHSELSYYDDLPRFYPLSAINFNCTSQQMKGAVNQRVFDVPAAGAFLLTDARRQMEDLFEPGREVAVYDSPDEIPELAARFLAHPEERAAIARAARKRILAEHAYEHRVRSLIETMRSAFG